MITKYSYDNIDAMFKSIRSNSELINSMIKRTKENDKIIADKMCSYALNKSIFSQDQMSLYKSYVENKEDIEIALNNYSREIKDMGGIRQIGAEICNDENACKNVHNIFDKINSLQIKIMEMLCSMIGRANVLIAAI